MHTYESFRLREWKKWNRKNFISYSKTAFAMKNYYRKLLKLFFVLKLFACKMEKVLLCYNFCYIEEERQRMKKNEITLVKERRVKKLQLTDMLSFQFFYSFHLLILSVVFIERKELYFVEIEKLFVLVNFLNRGHKS